MALGTMQTHMRLHLMGYFRLQMAGQSVRLESRTVEALLAYLALKRERPHSREALCGLLWPEMPEERAA